MVIKKKSLIVTMVSGFVLSCVLILTLVGYVAYAELRNEESKMSYRHMLGRLNARIYGRYIEISGLEARAGDAGALRGKSVVEGTIKNRGEKRASEILVKIKFFDRDGAVIYETLLDPLEPALGSGGMHSIPYISGHSGVSIGKGASVPFKKVLTNCPGEITDSLMPSSGFSKRSGRWSGHIGYELVSVDLLDAGAAA